MPKASQSRQVACDVLMAVTVNGAYANLALPAALDHSTLDARDRAFVTELVYGSLRAQGELDAVLAEATRRDVATLDPEAAVLLRMGAYQVLRMRVESHAAVHESVDLAKRNGLHRISGLVNAVLRAVATQPAEHWERVISQSTTSLVSHPAWIVREIERALGECTATEELTSALEAHNVAPRVTLCHLPGLSTRPAEGHTPYSPLGTRLDGGDPGTVAGVAEKSVRVQDEGSQLAALALTRFAPLEEHDTLWDMCAGPGGKTAILASEAGAVGASVLATEISPHRAGLVKDSTSAIVASFPDLLTVEVGDAGDPRRDTFTRILLDAPCSGLGALRRRPEARWVKSPDILAGLVSIQENLLRSGLDSLKPGGVLAYVTCSPVVDETTGIIQRVLGDRGDVEVLDTPAVLQSIVDTPIQGHERGRAVQLWTHRHGTDAMFIQLLRRLPSVG